MDNNGLPPEEGDFDAAIGIFNVVVLGVLVWIVLIGGAYGLYRLLGWLWP